MGFLKRNRTFLLGAVIILVTGAILFGSVVSVRVMAADGTATPDPTPATQVLSYNTVSSFGSAGYAPLTVEATDDTPEFISKRLEKNQGVVLLVYVNGASDDMEMLAAFNDIKADYAADSSFFSFEARDSKKLGDLLTQLRVSDPPILAIIGADGQVASMYTGWISPQVMEQAIADAVRGL